MAHPTGCTPVASARWSDRVGTPVFLPLVSPHRPTTATRGLALSLRRCAGGDPLLRFLAAPIDVVRPLTRLVLVHQALNHLPARDGHAVSCRPHALGKACAAAARAGQRTGNRQTPLARPQKCPPCGTGRGRRFAAAACRTAACCAQTAEGRGGHRVEGVSGSVRLLPAWEYGEGRGIVAAWARTLPMLVWFAIMRPLTLCWVSTYGDLRESATWMEAGPHGMKAACRRSRIRCSALCTCSRGPRAGRATAGARGG